MHYGVGPPRCCNTRAALTKPRQEQGMADGNDTKVGAGYVYAVRTRGAEYVKIGKAIDPVRRLSGLQSGSPHFLWIYATRKFSEASHSERELQSLLKDHLIDDSGSREWFMWNKDSREQIRSFLGKRSPPNLRYGYLSSCRLSIDADFDLIDSVKSVISSAFNQEYVERELSNHLLENINSRDKERAHICMMRMKHGPEWVPHQ